MSVPPIKTNSDQEWETPWQAVTPLAIHLKRKQYKVVWEPACGNGQLARILKKLGFEVICTDIKYGQDFFTLTPAFDYDVIVTNPPFNQRIQFLRRCYKLNKPFALLMPTIFTIEMGNLFKRHGIELLVLTKRLRFIKEGKKSTTAPFSVAWFCKNVVDEKLVFY
jgi:23S rRNA G2445 N2-methylase RlmL